MFIVKMIQDAAFIIVILLLILVLQEVGWLHG